MDTQVKKQLVSRLNRVEGQVRGLTRMVQDDQYCIEILQQIMSVRGALKSAGLLVLENHLNTCVKTAMNSGNKTAETEKIKELLNIYKSLGM